MYQAAADNDAEQFAVLAAAGADLRVKNAHKETSLHVRCAWVLGVGAVFGWLFSSSSSSSSFFFLFSSLFFLLLVLNNSNVFLLLLFVFSGPPFTDRCQSRVYFLTAVAPSMHSMPATAHRCTVLPYVATCSSVRCLFLAGRTLTHRTN